ncbi:hypothetical protein J5X84_28255 [Streptosporangiaceae bacterium NEAU-GS5]|nr:hypothetical protein [Streptosporangiaceae bacterium NEAU-GS5]
MTDHPLIDHHIRALAARLPEPVVDELADGLTACYQDRLSRLGDPDAAARAALTDFGDVDGIVTAFVHGSPGRNTALRLLFTGPLVGLIWGTTLILDHAWMWPIPSGARALFGVLLVGSVVALLLAVRERHNYQAVRRAAGTAASGMLIADTAMLVTAAFLLTQPSWPALLAFTASATRAVLVVRALPALYRTSPS